MEWDSEDDAEPSLRPEAVEPSEVAQALTRLKGAAVHAAQARSRLPQPLFWSLFHSEIAELKRAKAVKRKLDSLIGGLE